MESLNIVLIQGTDREARRSYQVSEYIHNSVSSIEGVTSILVDPVKYDFSLDKPSEELHSIMASADAFVLVIPEYNHSFPGTLKTLLDSNPLKNYIHKPVALVGVSSGPWGGLRAIQSILPVVRELGMVATFSDLMFPNVKSTFNEDGTIKDHAVFERVKDAYTELIWLARTLKWGRENLASKYHSA